MEMKKADNILPYKWIGKGESHNGSVEKKIVLCNGKEGEPQGHCRQRKFFPPFILFITKIHSCIANTFRSNHATCIKQV